MIPHQLTLLARPVRLPEEEVRQRSYGRAAVERWRALYGIDFEPLARRGDPRPDPHDHRGRGGRHLAAGRSAGRARPTVDLTTFAEPSVRASADLVVEPPGHVNAIARHVPRRLVRGHLAYARSVDVAGVELGDVGVGTARSSRGPSCISPCCGCTTAVGSREHRTGSYAGWWTPASDDPVAASTETPRRPFRG